MSNRSSSSFIGIRLFHNWIKRELIDQCVSYLQQNYNTRQVSLLDLAVGRAGDLNKWYDSGISYVIGFDIDSESIKGKNGAIHRYKKFKNQLTTNRESIDYRFFVIDLSSNTSGTWSTLHSAIRNHKFNIVSCQFAIHYFFKDSQSLDNLLNIVHSFIHKNGFFIGTTLNGSKIKQLLKNTNEVSNNIYTITKKYNDDVISVYGNKYIATLGAKGEQGNYFSDKASTEYLVDIDELKNIAAKYELMFIGLTPFEEWYDKYLLTDPEVVLTDSEKEFSFLNFSFIFMPKRE